MTETMEQTGVIVIDGMHKDLVRKMLWVSKAIAKETTRYAINGICINMIRSDNVDIVGTDGRRLHLANVDYFPANIRPGMHVYRIVSKSKKQIVLEGMEVIFPKYHLVMAPDGALNDGRKYAPAVETNQGVSLVTLAANRVFNSDYVNDALDAMESNTEFEVILHGANKNDPVTIKVNNGCQAVVMPVTL